MPSAVNCPTCGKRVVWSGASRWRPFCSERCRLIDLGAWFDETHRISEPGTEDGDAGDASHWPEPQGDDDIPRH